MTDTYAITPLMSGAGVQLPERIAEERVTRGEGWIVTVFDNDHNTYEQVMQILMIATGCNSEEAYIEAWEIDHYGRCIVHKACETECKKAAEVIATIGIQVEATPDE
jgi:ATP-dependent Clp protease adaptor protein ClpS